MDSIKHVLLVKDDARIAELLRMRLRDEGYAVVHAAGGYVGQREMGRGDWDALVPGLMLPGIDGLEIYHRTRVQARYTLTIIISTRSAEMHRILGLELSAGDYLAKPFSMLEPMAHVKALIRRTDALTRNACMELGSLTLGDLEIEPLAREVRVDGKPIELTPRELNLLHFFTRHLGKMFSRLDLLNQIWGYQHDGYKYTVNTHANRLRAKVKVDPAQPRHILTVWERGYELSTGVDGKEDATWVDRGR